MQNTMIAGLIAAVATVTGVASCVCLPDFTDHARDALHAVPSHALPRLAPLDGNLDGTRATREVADLHEVLRERRVTHATRNGTVTPAIWVQPLKRAAHLEV
jgi:hypothetical protein